MTPTNNPTDTERIKRIFRSTLDQEVLSIKDKSKGVEQTVKIVETDSGTYVIKFGDEAIIFREVFGCENLYSLIPSPEKIDSGTNYVVESYLGGKEMTELTPGDYDPKQVYFDLGVILSRIHTVKTTGFGRIVKPGKGSFPDLRTWIESELDKGLYNLKQTDLLTLKQFTTTKDFIKDYNEFLNSDESRLLHADFEDQHVKIKHGHVNGIFDFSDLTSGPRAFDLARQYISHIQDRNFINLIMGYNEQKQTPSLKEIQFYAVTNMIWTIPYHHARLETEAVNHRIEVLRDTVNF